MIRPSRRGRLARMSAAAVLGVVAVALSSSIGSAQSPTPAFDASAAADGVRVTFEVPGAPLTARLVDTGGPMAQASVNSLGTSRGYAALPDAGELVNSAPGLLVGLLDQGGFGLPPIELPSLPQYPLQVNSDVNGPRTSEMGAGPYLLKADSRENYSEVLGIGGLATPAGNVASVRSLAVAGIDDRDQVVARASSVIDGFTIGPISLGRVESTASITMAPDGSIRRSAELEVAALKIGGVDLLIGRDGLEIAGLLIPISVQDLLSQLLAPAGFDVRYLDGHESDHTVIAPALVISTQVDADLGSEPGTLSVTLGGTSATLTGAPIPELAAPPPATGIDPNVVDATGSASSPPSMGTAVPPTAGTGHPDVSPQQPGGLDAGGSPELDGLASRTEGPLLGQFDLLPTYLTMVAAGAVAYALSQLIRLLGVRVRWN